MEIDELKQELERLDGKPPAPVEAPAPLRSGVFDDLLAAESQAQHERQLEEKVAATNLVSKTCPDCFFTQSVNQYGCELCGIVPALWLAAVEYPANREWDSLRELAAKATIEELKIALRSGWCATNPERERTANCILAARIRQSDVKEVRDSIFAAAKRYDEESRFKPELAPRQRAKELSTVYDRQREEIERQIAALRAVSPESTQ